MIVYFDYGLHDRLDSDECIRAIAESAGIEIDDVLAAKIGQPFHEVIVACTLDTETGTITIDGALARSNGDQSTPNVPT